MNPTPLYVQLAAILRDMISSGELAPRAPLPSESYLQQEQGVSRGTVRMAVGILREEGLVVTIGGRGTFVRPQHQGQLARPPRRPCRLLSPAPGSSLPPEAAAMTASLRPPMDTPVPPLAPAQS